MFSTWRVIRFLREVRQEVGRVVWPSRKETGLGTVMVFVMAILASIFFLAVDSILSFLMPFILGLGN